MFKLTLPNSVKLACLLYISFSIDASHAQNYLFDTDLIIASHKRKSSPVSFQRGSSDPAQQASNTVLGYLFLPGSNDPYQGIDDKILLYHSIPKCTESKIELDEVFHHTEGSEALDFIVYDYQDPTQAKLASNQTRAVVPWDPNYDPSAGHKTPDAKMQDLARVMAPSCLPTSFKYIYVGSKRYREAKLGNKAWEK